MCLGPPKRPLGLVDIYIFPRREKQMTSALRAKTHPWFSSCPPSIPGHPLQVLLALPPAHIPNQLTSLQPHGYLLTWATIHLLPEYTSSLAPPQCIFHVGARIIFWKCKSTHVTPCLKLFHDVPLFLELISEGSVCMAARSSKQKYRTPDYMWISDIHRTLLSHGISTSHATFETYLHPKSICCLSGIQCNWISCILFGKPTYKTFYGLAPASFSNFISYPSPSHLPQ